MQTPIVLNSRRPEAFAHASQHRSQLIGVTSFVWVDHNTCIPLHETERETWDRVAFLRWEEASDSANSGPPPNQSPSTSDPYSQHQVRVDHHGSELLGFHVELPDHRLIV